jgi:hypothetical protein
MQKIVNKPEIKKRKGKRNKENEKGRGGHF